MSASPKVFLTASAVAALAAGFVTSTAAAQQLQFRSSAMPLALTSARVVPAGAIGTETRTILSIPTVDDARQLVKDGKWKEARSAYGTIIGARPNRFARNRSVVWVEVPAASEAGAAPR